MRVKDPFLNTTTMTETIHGDMVVPIHDRYIGKALQLYGEYAQAEMSLIEFYVRPGDIAVDIGANIGTHTIVMSNFVGSSGAVIAFEPQVFALRLLKMNTAGCRNLQIHAWPLSDTTEELVGMDLSYEKLGNFGAYEYAPFTGVGKSVKSIKFDDHGYGGISFMKIDVEGMEEKVLRGAEWTIENSRPILYVENDRKEKSTSLINYLHQLGYTCYWHLPPLYNPNNWKKNIGNIYGNTISINMLCMPKENQLPVFELIKVVDPNFHPCYGIVG